MRVPGGCPTRCPAGTASGCGGGGSTVPMRRSPLQARSPAQPQPFPCRPPPDIWGQEGRKEGISAKNDSTSSPSPPLHPHGAAEGDGVCPAASSPGARAAPGGFLVPAHAGAGFSPKNAPLLPRRGPAARLLSDDARGKLVMMGLLPSLCAEPHRSLARVLPAERSAGRAAPSAPGSPQGCQKKKNPAVPGGCGPTLLILGLFCSKSPPYLFIF